MQLFFILLKPYNQQLFLPLITKTGTCHSFLIELNIFNLTFQVTMYSKHAKCMLMENSPHADFEVCFYNGMKFSVWSSCTHSAVVRE